MTTPSPFARYVVILAGAAVAVSAMIVVVRPEQDNLPVIAAIFAGVASLLAILKGQQTHLSVNSRLDDMMSASNAASRAEGREEGRSEEQGRREETP